MRGSDAVAAASPAATALFAVAAPRATAEGGRARLGDAAGDFRGAARGALAWDAPGVGFSCHGCASRPSWKRKRLCHSQYRPGVACGIAKHARPSAQGNMTARARLAG
eukprot:365408-Chlamydomonas_euryale.AAC.19